MNSFKRREMCIKLNTYTDYYITLKKYIYILYFEFNSVF